MVHAHTYESDGGSQHTPVESQLTVDPGQIKQFASFLAEMAEEIGKLHTKMDGIGVTADDFGIHAGSANAAGKHESVLSTSLTNLDRLRTRVDELTDGSAELSRLYTDTEELNRANGAQITDALNRTEH